MRHKLGSFNDSILWGLSLSTASAVGGNNGVVPNFSARNTNPIYGGSDTVQPPAPTLLPCIKAFGAAVNPGLIDVTELANEMAWKVDRYTDNKPVRYVIDTDNDGTNGYQKWPDGWVGQGECTVSDNNTAIHWISYGFLIPFVDMKYSIFASQNTGGIGTVSNGMAISNVDANNVNVCYRQDSANVSYSWHACGMGI